MVMVEGWVDEDVGREGVMCKAGRKKMGVEEE